MIAEDKGLMQRDDWYSASRVPARIADPRALGRYAGQPRARRASGARKIATCQAPVLFEAPVAIGLIGHFVSAVNGGNLYRKTSFLVDSLGKEVFSPLVTIDERPLEPQGMASSAFDEEGVATRERADRARRRGRGLFPRQLLGAQARHEIAPAAPAGTTTCSLRPTVRISRECCARCGAVCWSPSCSGRA